MKTFMGLDAQQWYARGQEECWNQHYSAAADALVIAFRLDDGIDPALFYDCGCKLLDKDKASAKKCFDALIADEKIFVLKDARFIFDLAGHYKKHFGDYQNVVRCYEIVTHLDASRGAAWCNMASVLNKHFQQYDKAFECVQQALPCYKNYPEDYKDVLLLKDKIFEKLYAQACFLYQNGSAQKALPVVERLLHSEEDTCCTIGSKKLGTRTELCEKHLKVWNLKMSIEISLRKEADYWCGKGEKLIEEKKPEAALECAKQALAIHPDYIDAEVLKADAEHELEGVVDKPADQTHPSDEEEKPTPQQWPTSYEKYHQLGLRLPPSGMPAVAQPSEPLSIPPAPSGAQPSTSAAQSRSVSSTPFQSPLRESREITTPAGFYDTERALEQLVKTNPQRRSV